MDDSEDRASPALWWNILFDYQRQTSHLLRTMAPEPFSSSLKAIEENIIVPMQENTERLSIAILNNSMSFIPWYENYKEEENEKKQKKAA